MKTFLAVYVGSPTSRQRMDWDAMDPAKRKEREAAGMNAWMEWGRVHADRTVVEGGPLGRTKRVGPDGVSDIRNAMAGFIVVKAESHEAAAKMFENHPHFAIFPGEAVEIMECLPIPAM
jgi:hypothetical protein